MNVNSKVHLIVRVIFFIRGYRKLVKLVIFIHIMERKQDRLSELVERPKLRVMKWRKLFPETPL
jgi:hypothetical protein